MLCGPRLPHNWISLDAPEGGTRQRDLVIQFRHEPFEQIAADVPELAQARQLLARARHGIEFFGLSGRAEQHWRQVRQTRGLRRLGAFCNYLSDLAECTDYRLLSSVEIKGAANAAEVEQIDRVVSRITEQLDEPYALADAAAELGMSDSRFSRFFQRATGNSFTGFVNRVRINNACHLLMQTNQRVTDICYSAGFNNIANFNRRFLEIKGMTPTEFRRQAQRRFGGGGG